MEKIKKRIKKGKEKAKKELKNLSPEERIKRIEELVEKHNGRWGNPMSEKEIKEIEKELNLKVPKEYRRFLKEYGSLDVLGLEVIGSKVPGRGPETPIEEKYSFFSAIGLTIHMRDWENFPKNVIPFVHQDANCYCIVCSGEDKGKIIFWQHGVAADEVYPNDPDFWIEMDSFWDWLLRKILVWIEMDDDV